MMKLTRRFLVVGALALTAVAEAGNTASWAIGAEGAEITAVWTGDRLTLSGNGKTVDFDSAASVPWAALCVKDVVFNGDILPGKNLLAGLDDRVTINGSMPISTLRQLADAFLAGEVAPAEASGISFGDGKLVISVDVACRDPEKNEGWSEATVESVEVNDAGEVVLTIPVGVTDGVCRLRTK